MSKRVLLTALLCVIAPYRVFAAPGPCESLAQGIALNFNGLASEVRAGDSVQFEANVTLADPHAFDVWGNVSLYLMLDNDVPGSRSIDFQFELKDSGGLKPLTETFKDKVPANFIGKYRIRANLFASGGSSGFCGTSLSAVQEVSLNVVNDPAAADIDPPVVSRVRTNRSKYSSGEFVRIDFRAADKSAICTVDLSDQGRCQGVWHVELVDSERGNEVNVFPPVFVNGNGSYYVEFFLPNDTAAGTYRATKIDVFDVNENVSADLAAEEQTSFTVSGGGELKAKIDNIVAPLIDPSKPANRRYPGVVIGVLTKQSRFVFGSGIRSATDARAPEADSLFEIGSMTKVFTGLMLAAAAQEGKLDVTDPISRHLPTIPLPTYNGSEIRLVDLATHASGLPRIPTNLAPADPLNPYNGYGPDELYKFLSGFTLARAPGSEWEYSSLGMGFLGHIVSLERGASYENVLKSSVTNPLGLFDTRITLDPNQTYRFVQGHNWNGQPEAPWTAQPTDVLTGCGLLRSTASDLLKFARLNLHPEQTPIGPALELAQQVHLNAGPSDQYAQHRSST